MIEYGPIKNTLRPNKFSCDKCMFWQQPLLHDNKLGWCHKHAPVVYPIKTGNNYTGYTITPATYFPRSLNTDWCGEFQPLIEESNND